MVAIHSAYTQQINPEGVTPTLTRAQIWKGLERKVRKAQDFVPVISGCKVLEDKGNMVIREATFKSGPDSVPGQGDMTVREVCNLFEPTRVSLMSCSRFAGYQSVRQDYADMSLGRLISTNRMGL